MQYSEVKEIITKLENNETTVDNLKNYNINILKAIGWQFALKYKHSNDKESALALKYLNILIEVRTLVKSKLNVKNTLMDRYKSTMSNEALN